MTIIITLEFEQQSNTKITSRRMNTFSLMGEMKSHSPTAPKAIDTTTVGEGGEKKEGVSEVSSPFGRKQ